MKLAHWALSGVGLVWATTAIAADPVVYVGDEAAAIKRLVAATQRPAADFDPIAFEDLLADAQPFFSPNRAEVECNGQPQTAADLEDSVVELEGAIRDGEIGTLEAMVTGAYTSLACLTETVDPTLAARVLVVRGIYAQEQGDDVAAEESLLAAYAFDSKLTWDPAFPADAKMLYVRSPMVAKMEVPVVIAWEPAIDAPSATLDGEALTGTELKVTPGVHFVQTADDPPGNALVDLEGPSTVLVLPSLFGEEAGAFLADEARRDLLSELLSRELDPDAITYLVTDAGMHKGLPGRSEWGGLEDVIVPDEPVEDPELPREPGEGWTPLLQAGVVVAAIGGVALASGGILAGVSDARARKFAEESTLASKCSCHRAIRWRTVGQGIAGGGAVLLLTGASIAVMQPLAADKPAPLAVRFNGQF